MECRIGGCGRPVHVKRDQLCKRHYARKWRHGDPEAWIKPKRGVCSIDDCERPHAAKGMCDTHYRHNRKGSRVRPRFSECAACGGPIGAGRSPLTVYCSLQCRVAVANARAAGRTVRPAAKECVECGKPLPPNRHRAMIVCSTECRRERQRMQLRKNWLWKLYGLTVEQYDAILARQGGVCAGCRGSEVVLCVDHDKETGEVRGILCRNCNTGIGALRHDPGVLRRLVRYLERPPARG